MAKQQLNVQGLAISVDRRQGNPGFKVMQMRNSKDAADDSRLDITPQRFIQNPN